MIVIFGASGAVGTPAIRHLAQAGREIRAFTSNPRSAERLSGLGAGETAIGDFRSDADVARALAGADSVLLVSPRFTEDEAGIGIRVVEAAKSEGVGHLVYSSAFHPQLSKMDHHAAKLRIEEAVVESGLAFTIVQPSMFMQAIGRCAETLAGRGFAGDRLGETPSYPPFVEGQKRHSRRQGFATPGATTDKNSPPMPGGWRDLATGRGREGEGPLVALSRQAGLDVGLDPFASAYSIYEAATPRHSLFRLHLALAPRHGVGLAGWGRSRSRSRSTPNSFAGCSALAWIRGL